MENLFSHTLTVCWTSKPTEWETPTTQDKTRSCCFQPLQKREIEGCLTNQKSLDRQGLITLCRLRSDPASQREWKLFHIYRTIGYLHTSGLIPVMDESDCLCSGRNGLILFHRDVNRQEETMDGCWRKWLHVYFPAKLPGERLESWLSGWGHLCTWVWFPTPTCSSQSPQLQFQWIQYLLVTLVGTRSKYGAQTYLKEKYS